MVIRTLKWCALQRVRDECILLYLHFGAETFCSDSFTDSALHGRSDRWHEGVSWESFPQKFLGSTTRVIKKENYTCWKRCQSHSCVAYWIGPVGQRCKWRSRLQCLRSSRHIAGIRPRIQLEWLEVFGSHLLRSTSNSCSEHCFHFGVTRNDVVHLWLLLSRHWGFRLSHLRARPVICLFDNLAVQINAHALGASCSSMTSVHAAYKYG